MPPIVHDLFPAFTGQVIVPHAPNTGLQVTSHLHELAHIVAPQAPEPSQSSVHLPVPHVSAAHAPLPVQVTLHAPALHVMFPHGAASVHVIAQFHVCGHVIGWPLPVMLHVPVGKSHDAHAGGHTGASIGLASMFDASIGPPTTQ